MSIMRIAFLFIFLLCASVCAHTNKQDNSLVGESYLGKIQRRYIPRLPYLMIPAIIIPIVKKGAEEGVLKGYMLVMIELKGLGTKEYRKMQQDIILIRDEIFCDLYSAMSRLWIEPEAPVAKTIEKRIKKRINKFYKKTMVESATLHLLQLTLNQLPKNDTPTL